MEITDKDLDDFIGADDAPDYKKQTVPTHEKTLSTAQVEAKPEQIPTPTLEIEKNKDTAFVDLSSLKPKPTMKKKQTVPTGWVFPLSSVGDSYELTEFGKTVIKYVNVKDPNNSDSGYYACFSRKATDKTWNTWNYMCSKHYQVVSLEKFAQEFVKTNNLTSTPTTSHSPFVVSWRVDTNKKVDVFDNEYAKMVYHMFTGCNLESLDNTNLNTEVLLLNSYNGTKSIIMNYVSKITFNLENGQKYTYRDYFILNNNRKRTTHKNSHIQKIFEEEVQFEKKAQEAVVKLRNYTDNTDEMIEKLSGKFEKDHKRKFISYCDMLGKNNKNALYILMNASLTLDSKDYSPSEHCNIMKIASDYINKAIK